MHSYATAVTEVSGNPSSYLPLSPAGAQVAEAFVTTHAQTGNVVDDYRRMAASETSDCKVDHLLVLDDQHVICFALYTVSFLSKAHSQSDYYQPRGVNVPVTPEGSAAYEYELPRVAGSTYEVPQTASSAYEVPRGARGDYEPVVMHAKPAELAYSPITY